MKKKENISDYWRTLFIQKWQRNHRKNFANELQEVQTVISNIDAQKVKNKVSKEKTMQGKMLYSPRGLNKAFKAEFDRRNWKKEKIYCDYQDYNYYASDFAPYVPSGRQRPHREMDFLKNRVGVEV